MKEQKKKRSRWPLWLLFFVLMGVICYLSFQNGEASKQLGNRLQEFLADKASRYIQINTEAETFTYIMRQMGRGLLFFLMGVVTTAAVNLSFPRINWFIKTMITMSFLGLFSYFTEKMKTYIGSRHYAPREMAFSLIASMSGFVLMTVLSLFFRTLLGNTGNRKR